MARTGVANLPLHGGKAPRWLFDRMVKLSRAIVETMVCESGPEFVLKRLADPFWFQALGCVLGFDWHSSGVTTTTCGALKEGTKDIQRELGLYFCGGKGGASRKTPDEIIAAGDSISADAAQLVYASRMSAKVDSAAVQDGYQIYQHMFAFTSNGGWVVVQQGMNEETRYARRYHWLGEDVSDFVCEPHAAVCCDSRGQLTLNLVAEESAAVRARTANIALENPEKLVAELKRVQALNLPARHRILAADIHPDRIRKTLVSAYERAPGDFVSLIGTPNVGPATLRALTLLSEILYGDEASFRDPVRFSFAHGGKDGIPYPVDRPGYDKTISMLKKAVLDAKLGRTEQLDALRRLSRFEPE